VIPELPNLEQRWLSFTVINSTQSKCKVYSAGTGPSYYSYRKTETILQGAYEQESLTELAINFKSAGLIVHDRMDRIVPYSHAEAFSSAWPGAKLFDTHKLGHSRILKDEKVIQVIASQMLT